MDVAGELHWGRDTSVWDERTDRVVVVAADETALDAGYYDRAVRPATARVSSRFRWIGAIR